MELKERHAIRMALFSFLAQKVSDIGHFDAWLTSQQAQIEFVSAVAQASSRRAPFPKKTHDVCLRQEILSFLKNRTRRNLNVLYVKKM